MKNRFVAVGLLIPALCLSILTACAQLGMGGGRTSGSPTLNRIISKGELRVGTAGNMPPLNMTTRDGKVIGLEPDLANYLAYTMGVKLKLETMPFAELQGALESGKIDMILSSMTITPKRNLRMAFAGPYFVSGKCVLTKTESLASMESAADINAANLRITALEASTSQEFIERYIPAAKLSTSKDYEEAVNKVLSGEVDAMLADYPICLVTLARNPNSGLVSVITRLTYEPIGIALPADDPLLVNFVENLLQGLALSGRLAALQQRWFEQPDWLLQLP
jgi:polar amino acid transport system substrate-binding protein